MMTNKYLPSNFYQIKQTTFVLIFFKKNEIN